MGIFNWLFGKPEAPKEPAKVAVTMPATDTTSEVIRIGASGARIVKVSQKRIEYVDMAGKQQFIDLEICAKNWVGWHDQHAHEFFPLPGASDEDVTTWNARCVGQRGALDNPPWAEFTNERKTRFEFETGEALYRELLGPLMQAGWHTFDID
jgi:hypothetical protein